MHDKHGGGGADSCVYVWGHEAVSCVYGRLEDPLNKTVTKITFSRFHLHYKTQHYVSHQ